eukprot:IDg12026t1
MASSSFQRGSHRVKKRLSRAVASSKAILERMPEDYVEGRRRLEGVLATRRRAAEIVHRSSSNSGMVETEAAAVLVSLRAAEREAEVRCDDATGAHISDVVGAYLTEIASVRTSFADVEAAFHETRRYDEKIARLRAGRRSREEKIASNTAKLSAARAKYHAKLSGVMAMIEKTSGKRDAFLQSAFYAFWLAEISYELPLFIQSQQIRETVERRKSKLADLKMCDPKPLPILD